MICFGALHGDVCHFFYNINWCILTELSNIRSIFFQVIAFTVLDFSVFHDSTCSGDRLEYYEGPDTLDAEPLVYCGYHISRIPRSNGTNVLLKFFSYNKGSRRGFKIAYKAVSRNSTFDVIDMHNIGEY